MAGAGTESRRARRRRRLRRMVFGLVAAAVVVTAASTVGVLAVSRDRDHASRATNEAPPDSTTTTVAPTTTTAPPYTGWVDPASAFQPYTGSTVPGLLTFRGNPTRNYYGKGPVPRAPHVVWQYPDHTMCAQSEDRGKTTKWCGNGWTGQPAVFERDGRTLVVFGAYDRAVHLVDGATGIDVVPPFATGDIIKGSVTVDPDGYPLIYAGSRDNKLPRPRDRPARAHRAVVARRVRGVADEVERRLGRQRARAEGLAVRGRREQPDPRGEAQPRRRCRRPRHRRARAGVARARVGRPGAAGLRERGVDRELGRGVGQHPLLRELGRARAGLGHRSAADRCRRTAARLPVLDRQRHRRHDRGRRERDALRRVRVGAAPPALVGGRPDDGAGAVARRGAGARSGHSTTTGSSRPASTRARASPATS